MTLAVLEVEQLVSVMEVGATVKAGAAWVPGTFATRLVAVRPAESRTTMGNPGAPTQMPTGITSKLPPLKETVSRVVWKALVVFDTV